MNQDPITLLNNPEPKPAEDYYRLRREGIDLIEQMGSQLWTDFNTHDPGITILEALCYAITELAYRIGWDIKDLLTPPTSTNNLNSPFLDQPFFTAKEILTVNPWTVNDFRRLLIDLDLVRNAWVFCKECACDLVYYAWCENNQLMLSYQPPINSLFQPKKVELLGLYEVLLELETDLELGDLNDRKIVHTHNFFDTAVDDKLHPLTMELRFPEWELEKGDEWDLFLQSEVIKEISVNFNRSKVDSTPMNDTEVGNNWRNVFYITYKLVLDQQEITIENVSLRLFSDAVAKNKIINSGPTQELQIILKNETSLGFIQRYRQKLLKVREAVKNAKETLQNHRNLDEDYCRVKNIEVADIAVCADVEVVPDADIERIQAQIWFEIEEYFNPSLPFHTLQELTNASLLTENIFNGPAVKNGFITTEALEAAELKSVLRVSDIINHLMDIEGVVSVNNLLLTQYDSEGNVIKGMADPSWHNGNPLFKEDKTSAAWLLFVKKMHQPRLYHNLSRFLFYKNGLPFMPRMDEVQDTLLQLQGQAEQHKIKDTPSDLPVPLGAFRNPEDYTPVQYSFPLTYGIGPEGLPSNASALRRAQAKQLKAYLMVFEQILGNAFAQIAHTADLFSLNPLIERTYFIHEFSKAIIQGYNEIVEVGSSPSSLLSDKLKELTETSSEFYKRRNRFLNHIMARFGENFDEYTLLIENLKGQEEALNQLINKKVSFLKSYPFISRDRNKAFDYTESPFLSENISGLKRRVGLLLGYPELTFFWTLSETLPHTVIHYQLKDKKEVIWLEGDINITASDEATAKQKAFQELVVQIGQINSYAIVPAGEGNKYKLELKGTQNNSNPFGQHPTFFETEINAKAFRDKLLNWGGYERAIIVEHLLLRPKFFGDALYPACSDGPCVTCGDEDPYSFRLTIVMPSWVPPYNTNLEMRRFAERTFRREIPSHLLGKICWVDNGETFEKFEDAWYKWLESNSNPNSIIDWTEERSQERIEAILLRNLVTDPVTIKPQKDELCKCALNILSQYGTAFYHWMDTKKEGPLADLEAPFTFSLNPVLCGNLTFKTDTTTTIEGLLQKRYNKYKPISYWLHKVVNLLSNLHNTYPVATLHDCDDGSDQNPVRLGSTALGNYPLSDEDSPLP